ncbi:MAG: YggU family protein [Actinobacteria bacterium]|nr:YggU family protein [Actinomycetota bacterium]
MPKINKSGDSFVLDVWIQPRSSRTEIVGSYRETLKIKIKAPPVEGKANQECLRFLASFFDVKKNQIKLISGETGRLKRIAISGISYEEIVSKLEKYI